MSRRPVSRRPVSRRAEPPRLRRRRRPSSVLCRHPRRARPDRRRPGPGWRARPGAPRPPAPP
ncbi:hypothetical protein E3T48_05180 [Cryobacterium fucosi]|uniref:Uncharacterized protein n=1 Tax=Cryobacterium fucosi TaxID=1259157 RepID=A0A4V3IVQ0_9MICO|nr:hypothetical protein E3T48_05180 [Cryobacterium fucosi]